MGALIIILPILAFDVWLAWTTGRRQTRKWREAKAWKPLAATIAAGLVLAIFCAYIVEYKNGSTIRLKGFPIPFVFSSLENGKWVVTTSATPLVWLERFTDAVTGLVAPLIPFKFAEFLRVVKEEIK